MVRPRHSKSIERPEPTPEALEAFVRLHQYKRSPDTSEPLIWAGLGLFIVLLYALILTTHWFPN
jgi:hypothetical protein